jgi:hypothetical protein
VLPPDNFGYRLCTVVVHMLADSRFVRARQPEYIIEQISCSFFSAYIISKGLICFLNSVRWREADDSCPKVVLTISKAFRSEILKKMK